MALDLSIQAGTTGSALAENQEWNGPRCPVPFRITELIQRRCLGWDSGTQSSRDCETTKPNAENPGLGTERWTQRTSSNFGLLKDDQIVNALFLKRPERLEALGLILLISLLIWRLIELVMRTELQAREASNGWRVQRQRLSGSAI